MANTSHNNPKSFKKDKFKSDNQPKSDKDCGLGVHAASNQHNEKNFEFYWGYNNHVLVDCITGLPIFELTTTADVSGSTIALNILSQTTTIIPEVLLIFKSFGSHQARPIFCSSTLFCPLFVVSSCFHRNAYKINFLPLELFSHSILSYVKEMLLNSRAEIVINRQV